MNKGKFIVIEGLDGCGKTTQVEMLCKYLNEQGIPAVAEKEPVYGTPIGNLIRLALHKEIEISQEAMAYLHVADRMEHISRLKKLIESGTTVICDRYVMSNMAYNARDNTEIFKILRLNEECLEKMRPDITIFMSLSPELCALRRSCRNTEELYDRMEWQKKIDANYRTAMKFMEHEDMKVAVVPADGNVDAVHNAVRKIVDPVIFSVGQD